MNKKPDRILDRMTAGFGVEKLGLLSLRYPWLCLVAVVIVTPILAYGASQLQFSSDIREIFRSGDPAFQQLELVEQRFPGRQYDIDLVVSSEKPFDLDDLKTLKRLDTELEAEDGVRGVVSMFSALQMPKEEDDPPEPLFPDDLSTLKNWDDLRAQAIRNPLVAGQLLSDDGSLAVFTISLKGKSRSEAEDRRLVDEIRAKSGQVLAGTDLKVRLTGLSVLRIEIISALVRDQRLFRLLALGVGLVISWIFFRRLSFVGVAGLPAAIAVIWLLGGMWLSGQEINLLTGVAPTIVLVIVFSDCLHLLFSIRDNIRRGAKLEKAIETAIRRVGPACVLTSLTTTLALASLIWVPHPFVSSFGITAATGTVVALFATLLLVPALSLLFLRGYASKAKRKREKDPVGEAIDNVCKSAANWALAAPRTITALGVLLVVAGGSLHALNAPRYSYASNLPQNHSALDALHAIDSKLAGVNMVQVLIDWPEDHDLLSYSTLEVVREVHDILAQEPELGAITSAHTIEQWLGGGEDVEFRLLDFLKGAEQTSLVKGLADLEDNSVLITARFGDLTSDQLDPMLDRLERRFQGVEKAHPKIHIAVTGLVPMSARASHQMIQQLNWSLMGTIALILILIAIAMRSVGAGLISILPNLFPIAVGGAYLYLVEGGLQFTSLIAFTIGFGIAVDNTIHMLNRYRLERTERSGVTSALRRTIARVGPVIIVSTIVLAGGIGTSLMSELPMVSLYGTVVVIVLVAAMVGALLLLPALMVTVEGLRKTSKRAAQPVV